MNPFAAMSFFVPMIFCAGTALIWSQKRSFAVTGTLPLALVLENAVKKMQMEDRKKFEGNAV